MNNTEHWASQIIDELFGAKDTFKEQNSLLSKDISDELKIESSRSQSGSSFSKEIQDILSQNTEASPVKEDNASEFSDCTSDSSSTRTLNEQFSISSPWQWQFESDIIVSSSPLPDRLSYLNITHHQFSTKYLSCMVLDEHNQTYLKKEKMNSERQDYMNFAMFGDQMNNHEVTGISEPFRSIVASQHGDSESENSKSSILKTSENNYEFWSGDGLLSNETSVMFLDDEEKKIMRYRTALIVEKFRKIGRLFEVCFVVPLASFIADNSEFLEFCLALFFCTIYMFIWPKPKGNKLSHPQTKILTSEILKDCDSKELTQTEEKKVELKVRESDISTSSPQREDICKPRSIIQDEEQEILHHAEFKTLSSSDSSLKVLRDSYEKEGEKAQESWHHVTPKISLVHECDDTASSLEFVENSIENLELDESNYSSLDYTIDFVKGNLQDEVLDSIESSNTHDETDLPKISVERKISSKVLEEASEDPPNLAPICDDVKVEKIKSEEKCDQDSLGHSEIENTQHETCEVESYESEGESWVNVSDICVGNTDYSELRRSTDIKEEHVGNGLKESDANENGCNVNIGDSVTSWEEEKSTGGMDQDHLADASLEVNFSMEGMDMNHTNELPELDDESISSIEEDPEKEIDVSLQGEIPPFPDPSYKQSAHPDETDSKAELFPTSYRPHLTGKCKTLANLNANPSDVSEPILKRTASYPSVFRDCSEEGTRFPKDSIGDRLHEELEPANLESFEVKRSPGKESKVTTPLSLVDSTSEEQAECLNLKKKKKGGMKRRLSFLFRNIRQLPRHLSHSTKEKGSSGYQKHQDM